MKTVGIICEYNPFHYGHLYHLKKTKELFPDSLVVAIISGPFTQRGDVSILSKWEKTEIALEHGIDLVIELPFKYASQSADVFAMGAISILKELKVESLVFGSEENNLEKLEKMAKLQLESKDYQEEVKKNLDRGLNYPTAMNKALKTSLDLEIKTPNDLLGLSYIKEIKRQKAKILPYSILRTNDYHETSLEKVASATAIRKALKENKNLEKYLPKSVWKIIKNRKEKDYYDYLKYKIISEDEKIANYQSVDEGLEKRIIKANKISNNLEELIDNIKTKRYTYNRIKRMFSHILVSFTKKEAKNKDLEYIRVLGFNEKGQSYLNSIKKDLNLPLISQIKKEYDELLSLDNKAEELYQLINEESLETIKNKPIKKN